MADYNYINSLCKSISTRLAGVEVVPTEEISSFAIEEFLRQVATAKLKKNNNMFAFPGTKSVKFLNAEQAEVAKKIMVKKWLEYAEKNSNGSPTAMLESLKYCQERF